MKYSPTKWSIALDNSGKLKEKMAYVSRSVRTQQFQFLSKLMKPNRKTEVLDVGLTPSEKLVDSNFFEFIFPYPKNITAISVEDCREVAKKYHLRKFIQVKADKPYPFRKKQFEWVVSWATLEHVGGEEQQRTFLAELDRIGKKVFVTTPYKYFPYELHSELFFAHWLPDSWFQRILKVMGKDFWADEQNLRLLGKSDVRSILPSSDYRVKLFYSFGFLPTHLLIYNV